MLKFLRATRTNEAEPALPSVAADERVYAIGDIHGRQDLLLALLRKISQDAEQFSDGRDFRLVFLGDYIDRGDDSRAVLNLLSALWADRATQIDMLMGNHEAALLSFLDNPRDNGAWLEFGGAQTLASYGVVAPRGTPSDAELETTATALREKMGSHVAFLNSLTLMTRSGDVVFSHAGLRPDRPVDAQKTDDLIWGFPGFLCNVPIPGLRIVHGHWDHSAPVVLPGRICVDTGAYYSGRLTAVRLDASETFLTVDYVDLIA